MSDEIQTPNGVLPSQALEKMISSGAIHARTPFLPEQVQPSSIDLRLGSEAYRVRASFLAAGAATVTSKLESYRLHTLDLSRPAVLEKGCVYIVPLQEELALPAGIRQGQSQELHRAPRYLHAPDHRRRPPLRNCPCRL
jgi:dCTP deaminase